MSDSRASQPLSESANLGPSASPMFSNRRLLLIFLLIDAVVVAVVLMLIFSWSQQLPKRFGVVKEGELYRSGEITPKQLANLQREYGIRRIISLLNPSAPESHAERAAADQLGIVWDNVPLRGDGSSTEAERTRILNLIRRPEAGPTLVHCAAGANRTGLAIGLYRIHDEGWGYEQVLAEMRDYDFEDLPKHQNLRDALKEAETMRDEQVATSQPVPS